ncbi:MAG: NAD(P)H-dependent oxidoreductase subunit E [Chloroflexi bacterium]|nr:MAG: NAD(P)H-dependent oxidoreductase subunit E [Chloroflexota bacterium]MBL1195507.1 bidirectional hydrogenase complex protein HoxE [Chloroflexota bacterium]NOH12789.1 bidirectional hydrogenase complex protein HoxE [Chloroflexota bacterium]
MAAKKKVTKQVKAHPSGDERYTSLDRTMKRFKYEKDSLLEVLISAQEVFGYISEDLLMYISSQLKVPMSQVYGVATFYHLFTFEPLGEHNCIICTGTACHVKGADRIVDALSEEFGMEAGETTADGMFSLIIARCVGSCGLAPVVVLDGQVHGKETPEAVNKRVLEVVTRSKEELAMEAA